MFVLYRPDGLSKKTEPPTAPERYNFSRNSDPNFF